MAKNDDNEAAAEWVDVDALAPWARNPRRNDKAVPEVAASIKRFGFGAPIVARRADGMVIAGHTRLKAARSLGMTRVPVRWLDLDVDEAQLLAIADNKVAEIAEWDDDMLADVLRDLDIGEATEGLGFSTEEMSLLLAGADAVGDDEWDSALAALPEGDRTPIRRMTFALHDEQAALVQRAIDAAKRLGPFPDTGNDNGNGNALVRVCELWLARHG